MSIILGSTNILRSDFYNVITVNYGWDYDAEAFIGTYTYPESDAANPSYQLYGKKRSVVINMPIHYTLAIAQTWAKRYYGMWAFGVLQSSAMSNLYYLERVAFMPEYGYNSVAYHDFRINRKTLTIGKQIRLNLDGWRQEQDHMDFWGS